MMRRIAMRKLLNYGNEFAKQSTWKDFALLKFCLFSMGAIWGMMIPKKAHKPATCIATSVFVVTYIPLMFKLCKIVKNDCLKEI